MKTQVKKRLDQESRMREAEIARTEASTPQHAGLLSLVSLINSIQQPQEQRRQFDLGFGLQQQGQQQEMGLKERGLQMQQQESQDQMAYRDRALQSGVDANQQQGILRLLGELMGMTDMQQNPLLQPNMQAVPGLLQQSGIPGLSGLFNLAGGAPSGLPTSPNDNPNLDDNAIANARKKFGK